MDFWPAQASPSPLFRRWPKSYTTRIEPRAFYGATVTMEEGVRVFRPLPPHDRVIINPGSKTPLYLGYETRQVNSYNETHNYNHEAGGDRGGGASLGGFVPHFRGHAHDRRHHHHARPGGLPVR